MAENFTDELVDASILRSLLLQRVANGMSKEVAAIYTDIIDGIETALRASQPINIKNMNKIIRELKDRFVTDLPVYTQLQDLAIDEAAYITKTVNTLATVELFDKIVPESTLMRITSTSLMVMGENNVATIPQWYKSVDASMFNDFEKAVKAGVVAGETNIQISKRVNDKLHMTAKEAEKITTTAVAQVTNRARDAVYEANSDVIKGLESVGVLDSKTSKLCGNYDGALYDINTKKGINAKGKMYRFFPTPRHPYCRSQHVAVIKPFSELGIPIEDVPKATRASMNGQVSGDTTFNSFFDKEDKDFQAKWLGKGRYDLYARGKITLSDLINRKGEELTVKQLRRKYD